METLAFTDLIIDRTKDGTKLPTNDYKMIGTTAIIDQGQEFIAGYTDKSDGIFIDVPAIIFGDHTRVFKYIDFPFFLGADGVKILKANREVNYKYLYYYFLQAKFPNTGYARHFKWLKELKIPLPPLAEQKHIAAVLDKCTELIAKHKQMLEKYDTLIKSQFVEMFGDEPTESGKWKVEKLGDCLNSIENGKSFICSDERRKNDFPAILKLSSVTYGEFLPEENKALLNENLFVENAEVHKGDLLFTRKNTPELVGMSAFVYTDEKNLMMPDLIFRLNTKDCLNKIFLWKLINHPIFRERVKNLANGSAKSMSNISKERLQTLEIPVPPLALQEKFAEFVRAVDSQKSKAQKSLEKTETLYKALMQEYFG